MSFDVRGKVALVTGANRGIGKALVQGLLSAGASKVYAAVRTPSTAQPLVKELGNQVVPVELDLTQPQTIAAAAKTCSDVALFVNNAGVLKTATAMSPDAIDSLKFEFDTNVFG